MRVCVDCGRPVAPPFDPNRVTRCPQHQQEYVQHNRPLQRKAWRDLRERVLVRDGRKCVDCGAPATQVDHTDPRESGGPLLASMSTLDSVCGPCHLKRTANAGRWSEPAKPRRRHPVSQTPQPEVWQPLIG